MNRPFNLGLTVRLMGCIGLMPLLRNCCHPCMLMFALTWSVALRLHLRVLFLLLFAVDRRRELCCEQKNLHKSNECSLDQTSVGRGGRPVDHKCSDWYLSYYMILFAMKCHQLNCVLFWWKRWLSVSVSDNLRYSVAWDVLQRLEFYVFLGFCI